MNKVRNAIGYVRIPKQKNIKNIMSLEAQQFEIKKQCEANGYNLVSVFVDNTFNDKMILKTAIKVAKETECRFIMVNDNSLLYNDIFAITN